MKLTGAAILMECLLEQGVDTVFGYPGGTILNVYDELYKYRDRIHHVTTCHEQGASHAADGYARSTGKVGVCFVTSGPGATNVVTGMAAAHMDSSPVVFITCNVAETMIGRDAFQECDITGIAMPITKEAFQVDDAAKMADTVRAAFALARSGRPGPVLIDIFNNVAKEEAEYEPLPVSEHAERGFLGELMGRARTSQLKTPEPDMGDIEKLAEMIQASEKPMLICGGGVVRSRAHEEYRAFMRRIDAPSAITVMGGGAIYGADELSTGMIGMHGSQASNNAVAHCDLLIGVGTRFNERVTMDVNSFARNAKVVHIDIDRAEIDKNVKTDHHVIGDAKKVLSLLLDLLPQMDHTKWKEYVFSFPTETEYDEREDCLTPSQITRTISRMNPEDTVVATDVGQHQMWSIQHFHFSYPGQLLTSGGFGAMGFGLGAAIGAKVGNPEKEVIHMTGDGSFRMNCNELATEVRYRLPITTFILNNRRLGMVAQWQTLLFDGRLSETVPDRGPDFLKLAEAYGLKGARVTNVEELEAAIREAAEEKKKGLGYVVECVIQSDEMVRPMVAGGQEITNFLLD